MSTKSTLITIAVVLVVVVAVWYLSYMFIKQPQVAQQSNAPDTTENISADLQQIPDDSSVNTEMNSFNQDVQNF